MHRAIHQPPSLPSRSAFTLVEVLVGISISSVVIGAAYATWLAASTAWDKARISSSHYQQARVALETIERAVRAALPPNPKANLDFIGESVWTESLTDWDFEADRLRLAATADDPRFGRPGRADLCEVEFILDRLPDAPLPVVLMRRRTVPQLESGDMELTLDAASPESEFESALLASNVVSFDVDFLGDLGWDDEWYDAEELPQAVEVTLVFGDPEGLTNNVSFARLIGLPTHGAPALQSSRQQGSNNQAAGGAAPSQTGAQNGPPGEAAPAPPQPPAQGGSR